MAEEKEETTTTDPPGGDDPPPKEKDPAPKMVLESDLLAVKSARDDAKTKLGVAETEASSWQSKFNDVTAKHTTATTELESLKTIQTDLDKLKATSESDAKLLTEASENLVARTKDLITSRYEKLDPKKLDNKTLEQLDMMLETLEDVAPSGRKKNDPGPGNSDNGVASGLQIAADELAAAKAR